jgi:CDGSH-type Zn-finger protein
MTEPISPQKAPFKITLRAGRNYFWCACGRSKKQPLCDGSHSGTDFVPIIYEATESKEVFFCGCKRSGNKPMCDGTHETL